MMTEGGGEEKRQGRRKTVVPKCRAVFCALGGRAARGDTARCGWHARLFLLVRAANFRRSLKG